MKLILALATLVGTSCVASGMSDAEVERLADAIFRAEGGKKAKVSHGILSVPVKNAAHARQVCKRTIRNTWDRWTLAGKPGDFVEFLGRRYAPIGAKNDPKGLNCNWIRNVKNRLNVRSRYSVESM